MSTSKNKAIVRRLLEEAAGKGNQAVADELISDDFIDHNALPGLTPDSEGFKKSFVSFRSAAPDLEYIIEDMIAEDDKVVVRWKVKGTQTGEMAGIPATGKSLEVTGVDIFRVEKGKIVELWLVWDQLGMMQQLGMIPPMGPK